MAVVGGSFTGAYLAQSLTHSLSSGFRVVLIEKYSCFHYVFGFPRFAVRPESESKELIPYDNLAKRAPRDIFRRVQGEALTVKDSGIEMRDETTIDFDYLAIATGAAQLLPARLEAPEREEAVSSLQGYQRQIRLADHTAIIGGRAVSIELGSEIKQEYPHKRVTLIHSTNRLLPRLALRVHECVVNALRSMEINLILGERPTLPVDVGVAVKETTLKLSDGQQLAFDLIIG